MSLREGLAGLRGKLVSGSGSRDIPGVVIHANPDSIGSRNVMEDTDRRIGEGDINGSLSPELKIAWVEEMMGPSYSVFPKLEPVVKLLNQAEVTGDEEQKIKLKTAAERMVRSLPSSEQQFLHSSYDKYMFVANSGLPAAQALEEWDKKEKKNKIR